ncbi:uncharacterized protein TNCV_1924511, partial [Trichonephila clavipes]
YSKKTQVPLKVLLGADVASKLITGRREELKTGLVALETKLGWTFGCKSLPPIYRQKDTSLNIVTMLSQEDIPVSSLWDLEMLGIRDTIEQNSRKKEKAVMSHFLKTVGKEDGRYEVHMPWKVDRAFLTDNYELCLKDLNLPPGKDGESSAIPSESTTSLVLGLIWDKNSDTLEIDSESLKYDEKEKITKRKILSLVSPVFDPIGFLAPVMIQPKILLQATWKTKEAWDDEVNDEIRKKF